MHDVIYILARNLQFLPSSQLATVSTVLALWSGTVYTQNTKTMLIHTLLREEKPGIKLNLI